MGVNFEEIQNPLRHVKKPVPDLLWPYRQGKTKIHTTVRGRGRIGRMRTKQQRSKA